MYLKRVQLLRDRVPSTKSYPFSIPTINTLSELELTSNVTFFVGENGSGKSTLLEGIADLCGFHTAGGSRNNTYDVHASESALSAYLRLSWMPKMTSGFFLRAETFHQFATHNDEVGEGTPNHFNRYGGKSFHEQSHGESFLSLFIHRFEKRGIYLLDEPEAALSPRRQLAFLRILHDLTQNGYSQFIIATHSPLLLGYPDAMIYSFDNEQITAIDYEETDHYQLTKYFLNHRSKLLEELLEKE